MVPRHPIHFVGSIGLENAEMVFAQLSENVGDKALYYPDGETGVRHYWVLWQGKVFQDHPSFEFVQQREAFNKDSKRPPQFLLTGDASNLKFPAIGYAEEAIRSYHEFAAMKKDGRVPLSVRFQVSLPTPTAVTETFVLPDQRADVQPAYTRAMAKEVASILAEIPHEDLAIQWDICHEVVAYDGGIPLHLSEPLEYTVSLVTELCKDIPDAVHVGFHLCYGDPGHQHIIEPKDLGTSVKFANALWNSVGRRSDFVHMAVPRDRNDDAYFKPLKDLKISDTRLVLGLVHYTDGVEGTRTRLVVAERYASDFGIATECGFGRRQASTIPDLLRIHAAVAE